MKHTIRILLAALAVQAISACSTSEPVKIVKQPPAKTYVPIGK